MKYTNVNQVLSRIIEETSCKNELLNLTHVRVETANEKMFYVNKNVTQINQRSSDTFYTKEYVEQIRALLGDSSYFLSLPDYNRKLIQLELDILLSHDDYILKTYLHKSIHESRNLHKLFPTSFGKFKTGFDLLLQGPDTQRGYTLSFRYKYKVFYNEIIDLLIQKKYQVEYLRNLTRSDLDIIMDKYLTPGVIYDAFCGILLKTARDSLFSNSAINLML